MDPFTLSALIGGGSQAIGSGINAWQTGRMNKASRAFSRQMYERQYQDSIDFWNMQNAYNSPQAQMERYQQAGLNKNLIFGSGNPGNAGAIPTPDAIRPQFETPQWGNVPAHALSTVSSMYDLEAKSAQIDNLKAQNTVILQDALLKAAETYATGIRGQRGEFDLNFERELRSVSADARREALRQLRTNIDVTMNRDAREAAMNASNLREAIERMANLRESRLNMAMSRAKDATEIRRIRADISRIRETTNNAKKEGVLRDLEIDLRKQGINPNDPMWSRVIGRMLTGFFSEEGGPNLPGVGKTARTIWNYIFSDGF